MALSVESEQPETRAIAIASLCLTIATLSQLRAKGSLIDSDIYKLFEGTLANLESIFGQNGFAERLIGSIRRECVDHFIVLGEAHLRRILRSYARYYNDVRAHRSLNKGAPVSRSVQRTGTISSRPILGGLHHHYVRV